MFKKVSNKEIVEFVRIMSLLLYARLSILEAMQIIEKQTKNEKFKIIIKNIITDIKKGISLSKSFAKYPDYFNQIFIANLKVGEETGQLAEIMSDFSVYLEKIYNLKRKIKQAIRYPMLVLTVAIGVVIFMLIFIIPSFESLFFTSGAELPPITELLMNSSVLLIDNYPLLILLFVSLIFLMYYGASSDAFKQKYWDQFILKIPLVSSLYKNNLIARFSLSMATLLKSKVQLLDSLKISKNISANSVFRKQIEKIIQRIIKGDMFSNISGNNEILDITFIKLLAVGEESSELDKVFSIMTEYYNSEFDNQLEGLTSLLEPFLIILVGILVAFILIGLYLPMFEIINQFGV